MVTEAMDNKDAATMYLMYFCPRKLLVAIFFVCIDLFKVVTLYMQEVLDELPINST
jgi:hypothetical protein